MDELAKTSGATVLRGTMWQIAQSLVHLWLWNFTSSFFEFTFLPSDIGMRSDVAPISGKKIKVRLWLEDWNDEES